MQTVPGKQHYLQAKGLLSNFTHQGQTTIATVGFKAPP